MNIKLRNILKFALITSVLVSPLACSKSKERSSTEVKKIFYHGDPLELIAGSTKNKDIEINLKNHTDFNNYKLSVIYEIKEYSKLVRSTKTEIESGQEAADDLDTSDANNTFSFIKIDDEKLEYAGSYNNTPLSLMFSVSKTGSLTLEAISDNDEDIGKINLEHFSMTPDQRLFSILLSIDDGEAKKSLVSLVFNKDLKYDLVKKADRKYFFLEGKGVLLGWDKTKSLEVSLCYSSQTMSLSGHSQDIRLDIKTSKLKAWTDSLKGLLDVKFVTPIKYPPFSDLNTHCIYVLPSYLSEPSEDKSVYAMVLSIKDYSNSKISDADMFINKGEFEKVARYNRNATNMALTNHTQSRLDIALIHEMGHMYGLAHVFDGTSSVMSYKFDQTAPSAFDIESIQYLYNNL